MNTQTMELILQEIITLPGVRAAFLGDADGNVVAAGSRGGLEPVDPATPVRSLARTLAGLRSLHRSSALELDFVFKQGRVLMRTLKDNFLAVLCERQLNLPLLTMALDEAVQRLGDISEGRTTGEDLVSTNIKVLVEIAKDLLGDRAGKVIELLESSDGSREELSAAIGRAEEITRLFIDSRNAKEMARRMRAALFSQEG
jgi:predicted regulator of Ras-like GTPase activity (Roadblock/LC7/MglB family)